MRITRRHFMNSLSTLAGAGALASSSAYGAENAGRPLPTLAQRRWQDCEVGLIYHFDLPTAAGDASSNNAVRSRFDPDLYNPKALDTDQWMEAAKAAGAKYAIFTATHFNGFMQWQSDLYPYGVKQSRWRNGKGDVAGDFVASCHKAGILPGIYFSTHRNVYWTVWDHYVDWGEGQGTAKQAAFNRIAERMTEELCSRYGKLVQLWYDAGVKTPAEGGPDVLPIFEKHQPDSVFYHSAQRSDHRWIGNEEGHAGAPCWATMPGGEVSHNSPEWKKCLANGDPNGTVWSPGMVDIPLRGTNKVHSWFWRPGQDEGVYSANQLVDIHHQSVGRNCNLVIGEVVTPQGLVPEGDIASLREFGKTIQGQYASPLARTSGKGNSIELSLSGIHKVDRVVLCEDIEKSERVREYVIEGQSADGAWSTLAQGESIGHKWIHTFPPVDCRALRLRATKSVDTPQIKSLAAYEAE